MKCERSQLRDLSKLWKMFYVGNKMDKCVEIENKIKNSNYAESSKQKWLKANAKWATVYDETGSIYG